MGIQMKALNVHEVGPPEMKKIEHEAALNLRARKCVPCSGDATPLTGDSLEPYLASLSSDWYLMENHRLVRVFRFKDFKSALAFTNDVGAVAEAEGHHPVIELTWGRVTVTLWTHKISGLSENDFILAAKIEEIGAC